MTQPTQEQIAKAVERAKAWGRGTYSDIDELLQARGCTHAEAAYASALLTCERGDPLAGVDEEKVVKAMRDAYDDALVDALTHQDRWGKVARAALAEIRRQTRSAT